MSLIQTIYRAGLTLAMFCLASVAQAGFTNYITPSSSSSIVFQPGQIIPITVNIRSNNMPSNVITLNGISIGSNVGGQFVIAPGGTCQVNSTFTNNQTCTVNVQFLGSSSGQFNGDLQMSCTYTSALGGYLVTCGPTNTISLGRMAAFMGNAMQTVPALTPTSISLLALLLFGLTAFFGLRKR
jgi:hypothetical protein